MTERDLEYLLKRKQKLTSELKAQHSLPKAQRNEREIDSLKSRLAVIKSWETNKAEKVQASPARINKKEFKDLYKKQFGIQEPEEIIQINNLTELDIAWPNIVGKNVQISAPPEVKAEIKRRVREIIAKQRTPGFR